ncbi:hypothetical protein OBBRIDRAFT_791817 [Obba rivulosa]|uniref:Uncharacterized protein n=1 Tax=Obba rivulosa TaxID=1052685 RepID=A0A8E2DLR5_9APHY|nr:hypothetical protein OBBRIDRAFT_791817 [Obba rivulosa]
MEHYTVTRPPPKRSPHTCPRAATRSHFEDFMREIGVSTQVHPLCCVPRQVSPHRHSERTLVASPSETISLSKASSMGRNGIMRVTKPTGTLEQPSRDRTMSSGTMVSMRSTISTLSIACGHKNGNSRSHIKTAPLSEVDIENQHLLPVHAPLRSAQASLRSVLGVQRKERPALTSFEALNQHTTSDHSNGNLLSPAHTTKILRPTASSSSQIIRHASSSDSLSTASSSEAPVTPRTHSPLLDESRPTLADLEQASRFRVNAVCITCRRKGSNFPSCASCGEMWCSRECRLKWNSGRRHSCSRTTGMIGGSTSYL